MSDEKHVALFYKEGTSDKEYHVHLVPKGTGYVVRIEYGRRGSSLTSSDKTPSPVDLDTANAIFDKQVHEKKLKGYSEGAGQAPYVGSDKEDKISGYLPQLLNPIDDALVEYYFKNKTYCLQEKKDGKRIILKRTGKTVEAINRKGLYVGFAASIEQAALALQGDYVIDGEMIGEVYYAFDILAASKKGSAAKDTTQLPYEERYDILSELLEDADAAIQVVPAAFTEAKKRILFNKLKDQGVEGVVFKDITALYVPGRPASKGPQTKYKFTQTCTCQVTAVNEKGKRSVYIACLDGTTLVEVGKVTILPNFPVPKVGTLVEVKYLYRHVHGALYQPIYLGERDDIDQADQVSTLKIKEGVDLDDDES